MHRAASGAVSDKPLSVDYEMAPPFAAARKTASCRVLHLIRVQYLLSDTDNMRHTDSVTWS